MQTASITVQAILINYTTNNLHSQVSDGENEWCEWHDSATFRIIYPQKWNSTELTVFFPALATASPFQALVDTKYEFRIDEKYLNERLNIQIFYGALQDLKQIG